MQTKEFGLAMHFVNLSEVTIYTLRHLKYIRVVFRALKSAPI